MRGLGSDEEAFCSPVLKGRVEPLQVRFFQDTETLFAKTDGAQSIAGLVDDRLDTVEFVPRSGKTIPVEVRADGSFFARLPLDFVLDGVRLTGNDRVVECQARSFSDLVGNTCGWYD
jgi:hypothetical protein